MGRTTLQVIDTDTHRTQLLAIDISDLDSNGNKWTLQGSKLEIGKCQVEVLREDYGKGKVDPKAVTHEKQGVGKQKASF